MRAFTVEDLNRLIAICAEDAVPVDPVSMDLSFDALGLDSLAVYEVVTLIEEQWGVRIADGVLGMINTPRALIEYLGGLAATVSAA
jgi:acyl carrier protein